MEEPYQEKISKILSKPEIISNNEIISIYDLINKTDKIARLYHLTKDKILRKIAKNDIFSSKNNIYNIWIPYFEDIINISKKHKGPPEYFISSISLEEYDEGLYYLVTNGKSKDIYLEKNVKKLISQDPDLVKEFAKLNDIYEITRKISIDIFNNLIELNIEEDSNGLLYLKEPQKHILETIANSYILYTEINKKFITYLDDQELVEELKKYREEITKRIYIKVSDIKEKYPVIEDIYPDIFKDYHKNKKTIKKIKKMSCDKINDIRLYK